MTDDLLDRIDATIAGWEARPESWLPGDPLYDEPRGTTWDEQTVRPMIQEIPIVPRVRMRCEPCQVSWDGIEACWVCGQDRPLWGLPTSYAWRVPAWAPDPAVQVRFLAEVTSFQRVMASVAEVIQRELGESMEDMLKRFTARHSPRPPGPVPLVVDGHAYRRRIRNRRSR